MDRAGRWIQPTDSAASACVPVWLLARASHVSWTIHHRGALVPPARGCPPAAAATAPVCSELEAQRLEEYLDSLKAARDQGIISEEEFEHVS